jgi:hypothetical protein
MGAGYFAEDEDPEDLVHHQPRRNLLERKLLNNLQSDVPRLSPLLVPKPTRTMIIDTMGGWSE